jgi:DUF1680 family protein
MSQVKILPGFWHGRREVNARKAIFHQWEQLETTGCIENFRIAAGLSPGLRTGWFFSDSDAYKWLEAASRILSSGPNPHLAALVDSFIDLLSRAQAPDGYLFTYNQIHFPGVRWRNLQIEHELYCHGHLIEAGVSHHEVTGREDLLAIAVRAADRIVADFFGKGPEYTPGHEEIEIALLRLHQVVPKDGIYLQLARQFIERRGRIRWFFLSVLRQNGDVTRRGKFVQQQRQKFLLAHPDYLPHQLPPGNPGRKPIGSTLRWYASALSGKYFQQHRPVREQTVPVGHAVRFAYLATATAMLARLSGDRSLLPPLEQAWERMTARRMYLTGGIGSQPGLEGFGNDYELDPTYAYAETCAALGSLFWNWEMTQFAGEAKYGDLFEWQLYNAAAVGMGLEGTSYLYNNPLANRGDVVRRAWYQVPCCPSNLSRVWANLEKYIYTVESGGLRIHQYISSRLEDQMIQSASGETLRLSLDMDSSLPWQGQIQIRLVTVESQTPAEFDLHFRRPRWAAGMRLTVNGRHFPDSSPTPTAAGYEVIRRSWQSGDQIQIDLHTPVVLQRAHPKVRSCRGKVAVSRGPLVYCLESVDQPDLDLFRIRLDPDSLEPVWDDSLLGGVVKVYARTSGGQSLTFIPYFLWGNRGPSQMTVWVNKD